MYNFDAKFITTAWTKFVKTKMLLFTCKVEDL